MKKDNNQLEKRNESLVHELVREKAIKKAINSTIMMAILLIVTLGGLLLVPNTSIYAIIIPTIVMVVLIALCFVPITKAFLYNEVRQLNIALVNECMSFDEFIEVIPIRADEYKEFILGLVDNAKFLAILSKEDEMVEVYVKFNHEEQYRFLEKIEKEDFLHYYKIVEETEKEE